MKAVRYHEDGAPSVLRREDVERPRPEAGQILLRVAAVAFNPLDAAMRAGYLQNDSLIRLPHAPEYDVAGTVVELGDGVTGRAIGDAVIAFLPLTYDGAAAEFVLAPAGEVTTAPTAIPLTDAALPSASLTAWRDLFEHADLRAGHRILINAGGAGFAAQFAKRAEATVIATASPRSAAAVRAGGADHIVDHTTTPLTAAVAEPDDVVLNLVRAPDEVMAA